jgi:hypothetical protein
MRKLLLMVFIIAVSMALGASTASAGGGGGSGGQPCPLGQTTGGGGKCPPPPPAGNCEHADLVLLSEDAKIVCLYFPPNGDLATKEHECPDALIASGPVLGVGLCVFLPPADASSR